MSHYTRRFAIDVSLSAKDQNFPAVLHTISRLRGILHANNSAETCVSKILVSFQNYPVFPTITDPSPTNTSPVDILLTPTN